jgi:hypothetical protein
MFYQELFFDHYTQQSAGKHGPFLTKNLKEDDFIEISEKHIKKEVIQIVSSPKWSCPPISKESLTKVKFLLEKFVKKSSTIYFLETLIHLLMKRRSMSMNGHITYLAITNI